MPAFEQSVEKKKNPRKGRRFHGGNAVLLILLFPHKNILEKRRGEEKVKEWKLDRFPSNYHIEMRVCRAFAIVAHVLVGRVALGRSRRSRMETLWVRVLYFFFFLFILPSFLRATSCFIIFHFFPPKEIIFLPFPCPRQVRSPTFWTPPYFFGWMCSANSMLRYAGALISWVIRFLFFSFPFIRELITLRTLPAQAHEMNKKGQGTTARKYCNLSLFLFSF